MPYFCTGPLATLRDTVYYTAAAVLAVLVMFVSACALTLGVMVMMGTTCLMAAWGQVRGERRRV